MRYTVHCPCHLYSGEIETGPDGDVKLDDQMTCTHCSCVHRVVDVEPGAHFGAVRLARLPDSELVVIDCPSCAVTVRGIPPTGHRIDDEHTTAIMFCPSCHLPVIVEGSATTGYTAREPDEVELAQIIGSVRNSLFDFGDDPFTGL